MGKIKAIEILVIAIVLCATAIFLSQIEVEEDVPCAPYEIWVEDEVYYCDDVKVDGKFVTLVGCQGYDEDIELVGGQDWRELTVEVSQ